MSMAGVSVVNVGVAVLNTAMAVATALLLERILRLGPIPRVMAVSGIVIIAMNLLLASANFWLGFRGVRHCVKW